MSGLIRVCDARAGDEPGIVISAKHTSHRSLTPQQQQQQQQQQLSLPQAHANVLHPHCSFSLQNKETGDATRLLEEDFGTSEDASWISEYAGIEPKQPHSKQQDQCAGVKPQLQQQQQQQQGTHKGGRSEGNNTAADVDVVRKRLLGSWKAIKDERELQEVLHALPSVPKTQHLPRPPKF
jgi:hypothetical protein